MALMRAEKLPEDAVVLTEIEAVKFAWDVVEDWGSFSDTWALKYGPLILGGINGFSGILINRHFRSKLKLGTFGYISSVVPISIMPAVLTALFHRHMVSTDMLLMKSNVCPVCYEIRSSAIQLGMGIAYPMVLGPTSALLFANRYSTYRVPQIQEGVKVMFNFLRKITRPFNGVLAGLITVQFVASTLITYYEMKNNLSLRKKILAVEEMIMKEEELKTLKGEELKT